MSTKIAFFNINAYSVFHSGSRSSVGGTEVQLFNVATFLSQQSDYTVSFIVGDWGQNQTEVHENISIHKSFSIEKSFLNYLKAPFLLWKSLKRVDADIYIASSAGIEIGIIALFCKFSRKKFIYRTAHDIDCSGEYSKRGIKGKIYNFGIYHADLVVTQKRENQIMLRDNYKIESIIVKNAYQIPIRKDPIKKRHILWVSRCEKWKKPELFIKIASLLRDTSFLMICPKSDSAYFKTIKESALAQDNILFIQGVSFWDVQKYYDEAHIFIGTSDYEGFPNTFIQACIGRTPIVSYKVNPDNFILENNLGYCAGGDFKLMISYIDKLLNDEKDWKEKAENALLYVKQNHDINTVGEQWKVLLQDL